MKRFHLGTIALTLVLSLVVGLGGALASRSAARAITVAALAACPYERR